MARQPILAIGVRSARLVTYRDCEPGLAGRVPRRRGRVIRRNRMIAAVIATDPYSSSIIQPGSPHGRPRARRCQTMYVGMMLTVQIMIGNVETDRANGSSQSKYHGYTTGAHRSEAAIGHANASADHVWNLVLNQIAIRTPTKAANPTTTCGDATRSSAANTGSLKRKLWR